MIRNDPEGHEVAALFALAPALDGRRVLEIGCGDGRLTRRYAHHAESVLAIDPDATAIAPLLADTPANVEARAIGFLDAPLPERAFDLILFAWSL